MIIILCLSRANTNNCNKINPHNKIKFNNLKQIINKIFLFKPKTDTNNIYLHIFFIIIHYPCLIKIFFIINSKNNHLCSYFFINYNLKLNKIIIL